MFFIRSQDFPHCFSLTHWMILRVRFSQRMTLRFLLFDSCCFQNKFCLLDIFSNQDKCCCSVSTLCISNFIHQIPNVFTRVCLFVCHQGKVKSTEPTLKPCRRMWSGLGRTHYIQGQILLQVADPGFFPALLKIAILSIYQELVLGFDHTFVVLRSMSL